MLKKIIIAVGIVLLIGVAIVSYWRLGISTHAAINKMIELAPENSAIILNISSANSIKELTANNKIYQELSFSQPFASLSEDLKYFFSVITKYPELKGLANTPIMLTVNKQGKRKIETIFFIKFGNTFLSDEDAYDFIKGKIGAKYQVKEYTYNEEKVLNISEFYIFVKEGIIILSKSKMLIEKIIRSVSAGYSSLQHDPYLKKVVNTAGKNVVANLYVNYKNLQNIASLFANENYRYAITKLKTAEWTEFDITLKEKSMLFNGFTMISDSIPKYLGLFKHQEPVSVSMEEILPSSVSSFVWLGIPKPQKFNTDYKKYLKQNYFYKSYNKSITKYDQLLGIDVVKPFFSIVKDEVALVMLTPQSEDIDANTFMIVNTVSRRLATEQMLKIIKAHAQKFGNNIDNYISYFNIDEETKIPVYSFPIHYYGKILLGDIFGKVETSYFTFVDNYLIFGSNKKELRKFVLANIHRRTLETDMEYQDFKEALSEKSNFYFFSKVFSSQYLIDTYSSENIREFFDKNKDKYQKVYAIALQMQGGDNLLYTSLALKYNQDTREKPHTVWETLLDTTISFKPQLVINHNTNKKEIMLQDEKNNLYLINDMGRILWKLHIDGKILGKIYQIDFYKNHKLQYLFNTRKKLYLIDRNGNYVERYPITLRSPATNGIAVFDYEKTRDYRIFVAGEDKHIYLYNQDGNVVTGWTFGTTDTYVYQPIQHFRIATKDYIIFADSLKTYILNRRGESRITVKKYFSKSKNNIFYLNKEKDTYYFVTTSSNGKVYEIDLDGNVKTKDFSSFTPSHFFTLYDIDGDGNKDYIFGDKKEFSVYENNGKMKFKYEFENTIYFPPNIFVFPNNIIRIGLVDRKSSLIYLFNNDGSLYQDFPLNGYSPFTIGHFNPESPKFNLIVGSKDGFLYNYEVN